MERYTSPTGTMQPAEDGSFITYTDHLKALERTPESFAAHMQRHRRYEDRASTIADIFRMEKAIEHIAYFDSFLGLHADGVSITMSFSHGDNSGSFEITVPTALFENNDDSLVVQAARQYKAAKLEAQARKEQEAKEVRVQAERAQALELLSKYPDLLVQAPQQEPDYPVLALDKVLYTPERPMPERTKNERRVVYALLDKLADKGFYITKVSDGDEVTKFPDTDSSNAQASIKAAMELAFNLDECWVYVKKGSGRNHVIYFVFGNADDGSEVVADHSDPDGDPDGFAKLMSEFDPSKVPGLT